MRLSARLSWRPTDICFDCGGPRWSRGNGGSIGLFAADDNDQLEEVLASMPLHVWRTDEVIPLSPHPNDPALEKTGLGR